MRGYTPLEVSLPDDGRIKKRVRRACDRCKLKKSKCDGANPCRRCRSDNTICAFSKRKRSPNKTYPKGYVKMLEDQQSQMVTALQELYKRVQHGRGWTGPPVEMTPVGVPLTFSILQRLGAIEQENDDKTRMFAKDVATMKQHFIPREAEYFQCSSSTHSDSEGDRSSVFDQISPKDLITLCGTSQSLLTLSHEHTCIFSRCLSSAASHVQKSQSVWPECGINTTLPPQSEWSQSTTMFDDNMDNRFTSWPQSLILSSQLSQPQTSSSAPASPPITDRQSKDEDFMELFNSMAVWNRLVPGYVLARVQPEHSERCVFHATSWDVE